MKRAEELIAKVVLEPEQLKQMQEDKQYLGMVAFEMSSGFKEKHATECTALIQIPPGHRRSFGQVGGGLRDNSEDRDREVSVRRSPHFRSVKLDKMQKCLEIERDWIEEAFKRRDKRNAYNSFRDDNYL